MSENVEWKVLFQIRLLLLFWNVCSSVKLDPAPQQVCIFCICFVYVLALTRFLIWQVFLCYLTHMWFVLFFVLVFTIYYLLWWLTPASTIEIQVRKWSCVFKLEVGSCFGCKWSILFLCWRFIFARPYWARDILSSK